VVAVGEDMSSFALRTSVELLLYAPFYNVPLLLCTSVVYSRLPEDWRRDELRFKISVAVSENRLPELIRDFGPSESCCGRSEQRPEIC
jgi:hypothetical protein